MPPAEPPAWVEIAIVVLCGLNIAIGIFEVVFGRPSWFRRLLLSWRGRLPATPRDWRLHGAVTSLASGAIILLAIGQGLMLERAAPLRTSAPLVLVLAMGLVAVLMFVAAFVAFLRVEYRPRPGSGLRH